MFRAKVHQFRSREPIEGTRKRSRFWSRSHALSLYLVGVAATLAAGPAWAEEERYQSQIIVSGIVYDDNDVMLNSTFESLAFEPKMGEGVFEAALLDGAGGEIATAHFNGIRELLGGNRYGASFTVPLAYDENARTLRIRKNGSELKRVNLRGAHPYVGEIAVKPRRGGIYVVVAEVASENGGPCEGRVAYSADAGATWQQVAEFSGSGKSTVAFSTRDLPGSESGLLRLYIADGINCTVVERDIAIPNKPPVIEVERRMRGALPNGRGYTIYEAIVNDLEDGRVGDEHIVWLSKHDNNVLAKGRRLSTSLDAEELKVLAVDSQGYRSETTPHD